jgi:parallel beta-helix repeat protein
MGSQATEQPHRTGPASAYFSACPLLQQIAPRIAIGAVVLLVLILEPKITAAQVGTDRPTVVQTETQDEVPGPSAALFAKPFYSCVRNFYIAPTGKDTNNGKESAPWATLQHANNALPTDGSAAGTCVYVAAGIYSAGVTLTAGGNRASPTGYVVWRCARVMDGCKITADGGPWARSFAIVSPNGPNYIVIDGFELDASSQVTYGNGIVINDNSGPPNGTPAAHHIWMLNNIIHGFGGGGIGTNEADWLFVLHNTVYDNAHVTCDAQGSGISIVVAKATPKYTQTSADKQWAPFHQVIAWNVSRDNIITQCGNSGAAYDTDGNGIIIDTFNGSGVDNRLYPNETLVSNNVTYNNGGKGIAVFRSAYVTVANNTAYNNNLDPWNQDMPRGEIHNAGSFNSTYLNNVVHAIPAASASDPRCRAVSHDFRSGLCPLMANVGFVGGDAAGVSDANNTWANNISFGGAQINLRNSDPGRTGNAWFDDDVGKFTCTTNQCKTDPRMIAPARGNFGLQSNSPAISYGVAQTYLSRQAVDAGACDHRQARCP